MFKEKVVIKKASIRKVKFMKRKIIIITTGILLMLVVGFGVLCLRYSDYNREIKLTYIGSAYGECPYFTEEDGNVYPERWADRKYVYNYCQSYISIKSEKGIRAFSEECNLKLEFGFVFNEGHNYICAYGYPLKELKYSEIYTTDSGWFYNRAKIDKENYKEGVWYFYEIEDVNIASMLEEREFVSYIDNEEEA